MMLKVESVCKSFKQNKKNIPVLSNLSLEVASGETVAVIGPSGSGKSTLLSLLSGLDSPDSGEITFDGIRINAISEKERTALRTEKISMIFQDFRLLPHLTALENIILKLEIMGVCKADERGREALESVGLGERADHFPNMLSGGEKQRVAIARSFVGSPQLLLADEPSGSLDEKTGQEVVSLLFNLVKKLNMGLILVTHNKILANRCDRLLTLSGGELKI